MKKEDFITVFLVHLHLDVVPEVLLMVGMNFLTHKSPILLSMIDLQRKFFLRRYSLSSVTWMLFSRIPYLVVGEKSLFVLVDNREWEMPTKFHDDWTINSWEIEERGFRHNILLVQIHLDVVPEVLLMVGMNFLIYKSPILLSMIDLHRKKFFYEDVLCRASPGCCSRGSPGDWREKFLLQNL